MGYTAAVITVSDKGARGERTDTSGPALCGMAEANGILVVYTSVVPDEADQIRAELLQCADTLGASLILTTGGTGFSPRDVTPEATRAVLQRETPGLPEAMRAASMRVTSRGCLSRGVAGIRGGSLIINLPGSEKAARENLAAVMDAVLHGLDMLASSGSADCAAPVGAADRGGEAPSMDQWMREAQEAANAAQCGMYLFHHGVVRQTPRMSVRGGQKAARPVTGMLFSYDQAKTNAAVAAASHMPGIHYARAWLNQGKLRVGDPIMLALVGGDIRPHVIDALQALVEELKSNCVTEEEIVGESL